MRMIGVTLMAAARPTRMPRGSGRSMVMSATTMRARMMLTCPRRKVWRTGSNNSDRQHQGEGPPQDGPLVEHGAHGAEAHHDQPEAAARLTHENTTSQTRSGKCANGANSSAENGG